jgi:cold shock CspA family protein
MRKRGIVKSYDPAAGIGFLENSDGEEFFVHRTGIVGFGGLESGRQVEFDLLEPGFATSVVQLPVQRASAASA